jgi:Protein of unknown function (DUF4058)
MPSPFPGMDPWLERPALFPPFHSAFITYMEAALNAALPAGYVASGESRVYVDPKLQRIPDVGVFGPDAPASGGAVATLELKGLIAAAVESVSDPVEEHYLEILSGDDERLVTVIEVVSPSNKTNSEGRTSYKQKQGECRASGVNLVEIDLVRGGPHVTAVPEPRLRAVAPTCDYHVCVTVAGAPRLYFVAGFALADPLPAISVPLESGVTPVPLDLQAVFNQTFDAGAYAKRVRYSRKEPDVPLTPEQRAWAEGILRTKGLLS